MFYVSTCTGQKQSFSSIYSHIHWLGHEVHCSIADQLLNFYSPLQIENDALEALSQRY